MAPSTETNLQKAMREVAHGGFVQGQPKSMEYQEENYEITCNPKNFVCKFCS